MKINNRQIIFFFKIKIYYYTEHEVDGNNSGCTFGSDSKSNCLTKVPQLEYISDVGENCMPKCIRMSSQ